MTKKTWTDAAKRGRKIMGSFRMLALLAAMFFLAGCTSVIVSPLPYDANLKEIKLLNNPAVIVDDFVPVLEKYFLEHGIALNRVPGTANIGANEYGIRYTARRSWTVLPYLSLAYVRIFKGERLVAEGNYYLSGHSFCLSPYKWQGVETKMKPVYDELLKNYPIAGQKRPQAASSPAGGGKTGR